MRVALIVPAFPKLSESFIVSKFLGLLERGVDAHVVCSSTAEEEWKRFPAINHEGVRRRVHSTPPTRPRALAVSWAPLVLAPILGGQLTSTARYLRRGWSHLGSSAAAWLYLDAPLVRLAPDVVHFEFGALAAERMYLGELLGSRLVVSFRGYDLNFSGIETPGFYDKVWSAADALHFLGEDLWHRAIKRGCPPEKSKWLIPPAIDTKFWTRRVKRRQAASVGSSDGPFRILSVGRLEWKKGYEFALQAVQDLIEMGLSVEYVIVGDGSHFEAIAFARHQYGLERCVRLAGALPREGVREEMERADVFLHAAVSEGFCNAVLEAQAMELPVVTSDADGLPENVVDGETGFVVPRRGVETMVERLAELAGDTGLRLKLGAAGRRRVEAKFRLEDQIDAFIGLYERVLGGGTGQ